MDVFFWFFFTYMLLDLTLNLIYAMLDSKMKRQISLDLCHEFRSEFRVSKRTTNLNLA